MNVIQIESLDDPAVADYRNLKDAALVRDRGLFMAESPLVVRRLLEQGRFAAKSIFLNASRLEALRPWLAPLVGDLPVHVAPQDVMDGVVGIHIHRGALAAGKREDDPGPGVLLGALPGDDAPRRVLVLEGLTNHDNVGGAFRNAAGFGADAVLLDPRCCDPLYRKAIRVSIGQTLVVPWSRGQSVAALTTALRSHGFVVWALTPSPGARNLSSLAGPGDAPPRVALLLGEEGPGLTADAIARADEAVRIDMAPGADSLNVATAGAIAMHAIRAAQGAPVGRSPTGP